MKVSRYVAIGAFFCFSVSAQGQIFSKIKEKVKEIATEAAKETEKEIIREVVPCELYDQNCIERAKAEGKEVVIASEETMGTPTAKSGDSPAASNEENVFVNNTKVEVMGVLDKSSLSQFEISKDGSHVAVPGFLGSRQTVVVNGKPGLASDKVFFKSFVFSEKGGHYAYMAVDGDRCVAVIDGKISGEITCQHEHSNDKPFHFNEDGSKVAFVNKKGLASVITVNGVPGPEVRISSPLYYRGNNVYYVAEAFKTSGGAPAETGQRLYINNKPGPLFRQIKDLQVSRDGQSYAYIGNTYDSETQVGGDRMVINGKESPLYPTIPKFIFDEASGKVLLYTADLNEVIRDEQTKNRFHEMKYVFGNKTYLRSELDGTHLQNVSFSSDGNHYAFVISSLVPRTSKVVVDGKPSLNYEKIGGVQFLGNTNKVLFTAESGGKHFVVVDGTEFGPYTHLQKLHVSENGGSYAYLGRTDNVWHYYVNGKKIAPADGNNEFFFSPDGSRYAFSNKNAGSIVVDGKVMDHKPYSFAAIQGIKFQQYTPPAFLFSPKGNRLAYLVHTMHNHQYVHRSLMLDDKEFKLGRAQVTLPVFDASGKRLAYLKSVQQQGQPILWQVYVNDKPGPIIGDRIPAIEQALQFVDENTLQVLGIRDNEIKKYTISI